MTYDEAIDWWFGHINFEQRVPARGELKLDRMRSLMARLDNPHQRLRIVHVTGSKGKGSTSAMLAAVLRQAGYRVGLFTSPHLTHLEERFLVDGQPISRGELTQLIREIREAVGTVPPTFFEIATAVGFLHFFRRRVDLAVIEVGLGGRLDSTNICLPLVSVITSISYDHTRILGDRLSLIAREKAGIIKPGRPVVSGADDEEARAVIRQIAAERSAPLLELGHDLNYDYQPGRVTPDGLQPPRVRVTTPKRTWPSFALNLLGEHQGANAAITLATLELLARAGLHLPQQAVERGLASVNWPARMEVLRVSPFLVLDCAHNVASMEALVATLRQSFPPGRRTLIFAGSSDKDIPGMFRVLGRAFDRAVMTRYTNNLRATAPEHLVKLWRQCNSSPVQAQADPCWAVRQALQQAQPEELICVTGSVFLAGEVRPVLKAMGNEDFFAGEKTSPEVG